MNLSHLSSRTKSTLIGFALLATASAIVVACGGSPAREGNNYAGPGSRYTMNFNGTNFTLSELEAGWSGSGTWSTLSSGFKKMTISSMTGTGGPAVGDSAYALDVPGVVTLLKPITGTQIITAVLTGTCPTTDFSANWIKTKLNGGDPSIEDVYGVFEYTNSTRVAKINKGYRLDDTVEVDNSAIGTLNCTDGVALGSDYRMFLTASGDAIVRTFGNDATENTTDDGFIVGMRPAAITSNANLNGTYRGLVFQESANQTNPVTATFNNGNIDVDSIDVETGSTTATVDVTGTISAVDSPSTGFFKATVGGAQMRCQANSNIGGSGRALIFCAGQDPAGSASEMFTVLLIRN